MEKSLAIIMSNCVHEADCSGLKLSCIHLFRPELLHAAAADDIAPEGTKALY